MLCKFDPSRFRQENGAISNKEHGWRDDGIQFDTPCFVYGIGILEGGCRLLVDPKDQCRPAWYAVEDLIMLDGSIPPEFVFQSDPTSSDWTVVIGYELLATSLAHFNGILEREPDQLALFAQVRKGLLGESSNAIH